jgi:hypothetical protein
VSARFVLVAATMVLAASCAGDGVVSTMVTPPPDTAPTLTQLQESIFTPKCGVIGCHGPPAPEQGMNLTAGNTFAYTVGVSSTELSSYKRVAPGNATDSYLYMKVTGDPRIIGERMPYFSDPLTAEELEGIRGWIDAGALDN